MTQKSHNHSSGSNDNHHHKSSNSKGQKTSPRSKLFRFCYKTFKYSTLILVIVFVVLSGIVILGDSSQQVQANRTIFNVYRNSGISTKIVDDVNELLKKQSSKYVSNKAINLYIEEKSEKNEVSDSLDNKVDDLVNFAEFYASQSASGQNILKLPLSFYNQQAQSIVPETQSSKWLGDLKSKVRKFMQKNKIDEDESIKQLKWSRVKKLVDNAKFGQIFQLVKKNLVNCAWKWLNDQPSVILLVADDFQMTEKSSGNKRQLNKWIRDHSQNSVIIILSRYQINDLYDTKEEDYFKSYQVQIGVDQLQQESLCGGSLELSQLQCSILKSRFSTLGQLEQFLDSIQNQKSSLLQNEESDKAAQVLGSVCEKGHIKYYFYENQESANEVLSRNKKAKKSRLDRQLQALLVKWSQLKRAIGLNRIKDVWNTLTSDSQKVQTLSLWQANELGLVFDFNLHQLKWRTEEDRIRYQILKGKTCKGGQQVELELRNDQEQEQEKQKELKESQEKQDEQVQEQEEEEVAEQEYEDNFIKYEAEEEQEEDKTETDNDAQGNEENDQTEQVQTENDEDEAEAQDNNQAQPANQSVGQENQQENTENEASEETEQTEQAEQTETETEAVKDQQVQEENIQGSEEQTVAEQQQVQQSAQQQNEQVTKEAEENPQENGNQQVSQQDADETASQNEQQLTDNEESQNDEEIQEGEQTATQQEQEAQEQQQAIESIEQTEINVQSAEETEQEDEQVATSEEEQQQSNNSEEEQVQVEPTDENTQEQQVGQETAEQTTEDQQEQQLAVQSSEQAVQKATEQTTDNSQQTVEQPVEQTSSPINEQSTEPDSTNEVIQEQQGGQNSQASQQAQHNDQSQQNVQAEQGQTQNQAENNQQEPQPQQA